MTVEIKNGSRTKLPARVMPVLSPVPMSPTGLPGFFLHDNHNCVIVSLPVYLYVYVKSKGKFYLGFLLL